MENGIEHQLRQEVGQLQLKVSDLERELHQYQRAAALSLAMKQPSQDLPKAVLAYSPPEQKEPQEVTLNTVLPTDDLGIVGLHAMDGTYHYVSPTIYPVLGYTVKELVGRAPYDYFHPEDLDRVKAQLQLAPGEEMCPCHCLVRFQHKDGHYVWMRIRIMPIRDAEGNITQFESLACAVLNAVQPEEAFLVSGDGTEDPSIAWSAGQPLLQLLTNANYLLTYCLAWEDETGKIQWQHSLPDPAAAQQFFPLKVLPGETYMNAWYNSRLEEDRLRMHAYGMAHLRAGNSYTQEYRCRSGDGRIHWICEYVHVEVLVPGIWKLAIISTDITERKRQEENLQYITAGAQCLLWHATVRDVGNELDWDLVFTDEVAAARFLPIDIAPEEPFAEAWYRSRSDEDNARMNALSAREIRQSHSYNHEFRCRLRDGSLRWVNEQVHVERIDEGIWRVIGVCTDITGRKQQENERQYIMASAQCLLWYADVWEKEDGDLQWRTFVPDEDAAQRFFPIELPPNETYWNHWCWSRLEEDSSRSDLYGFGEIRAGRSYSQEFRCRRADGVIRWHREHVHVETIKPGQWKLAGVCTDVTEFKQQEELVHRQFERLTALCSLSSVLATSLDLRVTLQYFLDQILNLLGVDAAHILRYDPSTSNLEYLLEKGWRVPHRTYPPLRIGQGQAGLAAMERRSLYYPDLRQMPDVLKDDPLLQTEGFLASVAIPLVIKGQLSGILQMFHRHPLEMDAEWRDFAETLAGQAALAIDNTSLYENLQKTNAALSLAYDATIEGWSRALDLRDKETEGHSQRVTEMTLKLARMLGVADPELLHIRYGALLHDIGKMGIPDSILLKPGPLNEEEWVLMRKHPLYAYEMLSPIAFLRPALDIPYCHHEWWNGNGYPRGLKGEAIPLAARIFAVVDVWDALRSDRPYRPAMSAEQVRQHICSIAGTHLDPAIVEVFLSTGW